MASTRVWLRAAALAAGAMATALGGCASVPQPESAALPGTEECIFQVNVRGWKVLDNQTLLVDAPTASSPYLIKLFAPVTGLAFEETLAFEDGDHNGRLCRMGDQLHVGGSVPQRMPITAVRLLTAEEARALRSQPTNAAAAPPAR